MKSLRGAAAVCGSCRPSFVLRTGRSIGERHGLAFRRGADCLHGLRASFPAAFLKRHIQGRTLHHGRRLEDTGAAAGHAGAGKACGRPVGAAARARENGRFKTRLRGLRDGGAYFFQHGSALRCKPMLISLCRWRALRGMVCYFSLSVPSFWAVGFGAVLRLGRRDRRGGAGFEMFSGTVTP